MDLGQFRRSRPAFWGWIVMPVLIVAVAFYLLQVYCDSVEAGLRRRRALLDIMPDLRRRLELAKDVVRGFELVGGGQAVDVLGSRIHDIARHTDFVINALRIGDAKARAQPKAAANADQNGQREQADMRTLAISITGEGDLPSLVRFLDQLQRPQSLIRPETASLRLTSLAPEPVYEVELAMQCRIIH